MIREMQIRNYSERTISSYVASISKLVKFYNQPVEEITIDQFKDFLQHRITIDEVSVAMINITKNLKHRTLIVLAYSTGMRRSEIKKMKAEHIDSQRMQVHVVHGKGKKARYTILSTKALELLRIYYKAEKPSTFLFEPAGKKNIYLSDSTLNNIVKQAAKKARIKKNVSFHTLRHSFATHMLENGINLRIIQQFLGHTSIRTTSVYLHVAQIDPAMVRSPLDDMEI